jgi:ABC-2 type transport system ATP-binding protein
LLEFDHAVKCFESLTALDRCTFEARPGRLTGFLGPNGAGKTTAMRAVFGLVRLDAGSVTWQGSAIVEADRARFGYMPEERGLYPRMRVREQLVYLGELCGRSSHEVGRVTDRWLEQLGWLDEPPRGWMSCPMATSSGCNWSLPW